MTHGWRYPFLSLIILVTLLIGGCRRAGDESPAVDQGGSPVRLLLTVEPIAGDAPLEVHLQAELVGEIDSPARFHCPSLAWVMGNDDVLIARAQDCRNDYVPRNFEVTYTYTAAGSYYASARLLALDVPPSSPVQVLVRGATPTPAPVAAVPGPTIVIATPGAPAGASTSIAMGRTAPAPALGAPTGRSVTPPSTSIVVTSAAERTATVRLPAARTPGTATAGRVAEAGTAVTTPGPVAGAGVASPRAATAIPAGEATAMSAGSPPAVSGSETAPASPAASGAATSALATPRLTEPTGTQPSHLPVPTAPAAQVLPADLFYLAGEPPRLWRLPASGSAPEPVTPYGEPVAEYSVSPAGIAAHVGDGALRLAVPGAEPLEVEAAGASSPVWSRDGRQLAYADAASGVMRYDMVGGRRSQLAPDGKPLAWSRDGTWLLISRSDETAEVVHVASGARTALPVGPAATGGWLSDRDVVWLAGTGLRLVTVKGTLLLTTVIEAAQTTDVFVRPDLQLLLLVQADAGPVPNVVDLTAGSLAARPFGPPLPQTAGADFAWAPDGRHAALAGPDGLTFLDPATGASVPLVEEPVAHPQWVLAAR